VTGWVVRAVVAAVALVAVTRLVSDPVEPRLPPAVAAPAQPVASGDRIAIPAGRSLQLSHAAPVQVSSLLNVRERMRYGQSLWSEAGVPAGPVWVHVDRRAQIISVFRGPHEIGTAVILYGAPEKPTPAGRYPVLGKKLYHRSNSYGADMPYTMWLTRDGVAIHASDIREGAATHGCIGVPRDFARKLFDAIRPGDPVVIA